jgi:hypothetical protein
MNKSKKFTLIVASLVMLIGLQGCAPKGGTGKAPVYSDTTIVFAKYFTPATTKAMTPDEEGFIRRWSVLEPIEKLTVPTQYLLIAISEMHLLKQSISQISSALFLTKVTL